MGKVAHVTLGAPLQVVSTADPGLEARILDELTCMVGKGAPVALGTQVLLELSADLGALLGAAPGVLIGASGSLGASAFHEKLAWHAPPAGLDGLDLRDLPRDASATFQEQVAWLVELCTWVLAQMAGLVFLALEAQDVLGKDQG